MKKHRIYTHISARKDAGGAFVNYDVYYAVELEPGFFAQRITPANTGPAGDDYTITLNPNDTTNVITLTAARGNSADTVSRDGKIRIMGIPKRLKTDPQHIEFRLEDGTGPIGGEGKSSPHYGDAD